MNASKAYYADPTTGEQVEVEIGSRVGNMVYIHSADGRMLRQYWACGWYSYVEVMLVPLSKIMVVPVQS